MRADCDIAAWRPWQSHIKDLGLIEARAYKRKSGVVTASGGNHGPAVVHAAPISAWTMSNIRSPEGLSEVTFNGDTVSTRRLPHFCAFRAIPVSRPTAIPFLGTARCPYTRKLSAREADFPPHTRERARGEVIAVFGPRQCAHCKKRRLRRPCLGSALPVSRILRHNNVLAANAVGPYAIAFRLPLEWHMS